MKTRLRRRNVILGWLSYVLCVMVLFFIPAESQRLARGVLVAATFLVIVGFCISYHVTTRGHWRDTIHGVHIMVFSAATGLIMAFLILGLFGLIPMWLVPILGGWIYLTEFYLFAWRWAILRAGQREPK